MNISVFCGSRTGINPHFAEAIVTFGKMMGEKNHNLLYGGSNLGYMGLVANSALNAGAQVVAVIPTLFDSTIINSIEVSETILVKRRAERKHILWNKSDAFVALPGGIGTLDEITEMLTNNQLQLAGGLAEDRGSCSTPPKPIVLLNIDGFYDPFLKQLDTMVSEGLFSKEDRRNVYSAKTAEEVFAILDNN